MHTLNQLMATEHVRDLLETAERERRHAVEPRRKRRLLRVRTPIVLIPPQEPACC